MMRLDEEAGLSVDAADQGVQDVRGDVNHRHAVGALQMRMRSRGGPGCERWQCQVIDRRRATDVGVGDEPKITKCGQCAVDRGPMNSWGGRFRAGDDLVRGQMLIGGIEDFNHGLAGSGHPLVLIAKESQGCLNARCGH